MSHQAVIDGAEFARNGEALHGIIAVADLMRLGDTLHDKGGEVKYELSGALNAESKPVLHLRVAGTLHLVCQRCLGPLPYRFKLRHDLLLALSEAEFNRLADDLEAADSILASRAMNVAELVEDEIILSLPLAPKHAAGECDGVGAGGTASPFAALAALKKH